jgi:hypothetical protein
MHPSPAPDASACGGSSRPSLVGRNRLEWVESRPSPKPHQRRGSAGTRHLRDGIRACAPEPNRKSTYRHSNRRSFNQLRLSPQQGGLGGLRMAKTVSSASEIERLFPTLEALAAAGGLSVLLILAALRNPAIWEVVGGGPGGGIDRTQPCASPAANGRDRAQSGPSSFPAGATLHAPNRTIVRRGIKVGTGWKPDLPEPYRPIECEPLSERV